MSKQPITNHILEFSERFSLYSKKYTWIAIVISGWPDIVCFVRITKTQKTKKYRLLVIIPTRRILMVVVCFTNLIVTLSHLVLYYDLLVRWSRRYLILSNTLDISRYESIVENHNIYRFADNVVGTATVVLWYILRSIPFLYEFRSKWIFNSIGVPNKLPVLLMLLLLVWPLYYFEILHYQIHHH